MYSKTNPGATPLTPRRKRTLAIAGAAVLLIFGGVAVWAAVAPDALSGSAKGCVNITVPGSMGGETFHYCGAQARSVCHDAFASSEPISPYARPACRAAGLQP
jgi:hypothetical protein